MKKIFVAFFFLAMALWTVAVHPSDISITPRMGEVRLTQKDHEIPTPLGRLPITRSYDPSEKPRIFGPGWRLDIPSEISFVDDARFFLIQSDQAIYFVKNDKQNALSTGLRTVGGTVVAAAAPAIATAAGIGGLVYMAGERYDAALNERIGENAAEAEENSLERRRRQIDQDNLQGILDALRKKLASLDALRPKVKAGFDEITTLELEAANSHNSFAAAGKKIDSLLDRAEKQIRDAELHLVWPSTETAARQLLKGIEDLKLKACQVATTIDTAPAERREKLANDAAIYAGDAETKAGQIPGVWGVGEAFQKEIEDIRGILSEADDARQALGGTYTALSERCVLMRSYYDDLKRAYLQRAEILGDIKRLGSSPDFAGELAAIRKRVEVPLPPVDEAQGLVESVLNKLDSVWKEQKQWDDRISLQKRGVENIAVVQAEGGQEGSRGLLQQARSLARQARECAELCKRIASGQSPISGADPSAVPKPGFQEVDSTVVKDTSVGQKRDAINTDQSAAGKNPSTSSQNPPPPGKGNAPLQVPRQTTLIAAGQPAAYHIFATGSRLGWAGSLARHTAGAQDQIIREHLAVAGDHMRMANVTSFPPTKAWPNWSGTRSQFQSYADQLTRDPREVIRRQVATSVTGAIEPLAQQLSYQTVGTSQPAPNCDAAYMRLGFNLGYGQTGLQIAAAAANVQDTALMTRARQDAIAHLQQADRILLDYERIPVASGRCADLRDVRLELESLIPSWDLEAQVRAANHAWQTALERIRGLSLRQTIITPPQPQPPTPPKPTPQKPIPVPLPKPNQPSTPSLDPEELEGEWFECDRPWGINETTPSLSQTLASCLQTRTNHVGRATGEFPLTVRFTKIGNQYSGRMSEKTRIGTSFRSNHLVFNNCMDYTWGPGVEIFRLTRTGPNQYEGQLLQSDCPGAPWEPSRIVVDGDVATEYFGQREIVKWVRSVPVFQRSAQSDSQK